MPNDHIHLSDSELIIEVKKAATDERAATNSLFVFCTRALHMSEHAAYSRIEAARAARRFPTILDRLADGRLSLTTVGLLVPQLTEENGEDLLDAAQHQSKRDVERLIAGLHPQPDIPATIRALPVRPSSPAARQTQMLPPHFAPRPETTTSEWRYLLRVTINEETQCTLERARDLLRHQLPDGDPAAIIDRALTLLVADAERTKFAATHRRSHTRAGAETGRHSRRIPNAIRRSVWVRDAGRCAFSGRAGRCDATAFLEFHHVVPFARGGRSTMENLELRCRAHNGYEAERAGLSRRSAPATRSGPS